MNTPATKSALKSDEYIHQVSVGIRLEMGPDFDEVEHGVQ